ncbi:hypothetical protein F7725_025525 [Dissostichus mawsoni]|uniref:Protein kinase domain-containing protein n=1 Tax=Dissostichus mawsoni TaxID=36200 RepID=A0A7J5XBL4_DISMA|nr:hypothetical protein F7725_025525 [Dissostichus mawsoni]
MAVTEAGCDLTYCKMRGIVTVLTAFIKERKMGLNDFIQKLVSTPHICQHVEVNNFLKIDENQNEQDDGDELPDSSMYLTSRSSLAEETQIKPCDFDYLKIIGKGSFGKVLLARHKESSNYYAVKVLQKKIIMKKKEQKHIMAERSVLMKNIKHPFLVGLHFSFQTTDKLYFVLDYVNGGELFYHLQRERIFLEPRAGSMLLKLQYLAPEVLQKQAYDRTVDWWCLGSVLYEMLYGLPPFYSRNTAEMYNNILHKSPVLKPNVSNSGRELLEGLLQKDRTKRLGVKDDFSGPTDLRHFDPEFTHMPVPASLCNDSLMVTSSVKEAAGAFPGFSYGAPSGQAFL